MESCKRFPQQFISSTLIEEPENPRNHHSASPNALKTLTSPIGCIGSLEIFIHHARDIQNICIYHKQDVYAKLSLTNDPEFTISTKIINGGGQNPIFNDFAHFNVQTIDASLKCEVWMLSRAKNYLGDQLLGSSLTPLSEIVTANNKSTREFVLSSTDLFHSPAGFVQLSLSYTGSLPEFMSVVTSIKEDVSKDEPTPCVYANIEFPDLKVANEDNMMVSEYFDVPCANLDPLNIASCHDAGVRIVESFSTLRDESPLSSISSNVSPAMADTSTEVVESGGSSSPEMAIVKPLVEVDMEPEQPVVHQEIVELYLKSMHEFTESLANMKLPMEIESSNGMANGNGESGKKILRWKSGNRGRVFYGSRAFF